jgi:cytochrome oxidase Cu insertion factor (SCO1/SenC/PrrC family)
VIRALRCVTLVLAVAGLAAVGAYAWRQRPADGLDDFGPLGAFSFKTSDGRAVTEADLAGKVSVFACFFTCCTETCPAISGSMARLQHEFAELPDVRLVSLTVDPAHDTPEVLAKYAGAFNARPDRWFFLTGPRPEVEGFVTGRLLQGVQENKGPDVTPGNRVLHSERLVVVDRNGRVRGFFAGTDGAAVERLIEFVRRLHG